MPPALAKFLMFIDLSMTGILVPSPLACLWLLLRWHTEISNEVQYLIHSVPVGLGE